MVRCGPEKRRSQLSSAEIRQIYPALHEFAPAFRSHARSRSLQVILFSLGEMQPWTKAIVFSALSAVLIVLIQVTPSPEPGFAGAAFAYNISFFFPVVLTSFVCWGLALRFYTSFLRSRAAKRPFTIVFPPILLLPFTLQAAWIIRLLLLLREPV